MKRTGTAHWEGDLKTGTGLVSTQSGVLKDSRYGFGTRFEDGPGTNPEELIGAAHAGCYSMALSMILGEHGLTADAIDTKATVSLEQVDGGFAVTKIHLDVEATIPGASEDAFREATEAAKVGCPISKLMTAEITMSAKLK
ncbi:OsmC family peroxiredoxin [Meridianimarinicoccus roseus]|uniref:OsmC family peroxiredoxin n=1 Tax=Meridianimarinicoccus roseus TaxID=2072018 RepID=A0A2V2LGK7_9RHOB|nr:OsmC family protein [Meridianimarinicoccus roseus]PWR02317.1 OsmC family peroxiredoxin [Meridianimarinicoccus roseus]